ncbi:MAG: hypothetical protein RRY69_06940 [Oscillospiraceae bacterium]
MTFCSRARSFFADIPERLTFIDELPAFGKELYEHKKMKTDASTAAVALGWILPALEALDDFSQACIHDRMMALVEEKGVKNGFMLWPLRVALSGVPVSPGGGIELAAILGKAETLARVKSALVNL